jgi:hypothetical protein
VKLKLKEAQLERLALLFNVEGSDECSFLGYALNLKTGKINDLLNTDAFCAEGDIQVLTVLLSHFVLANPAPKKARLVKFKDLPGGYAYERAFLQRAVQPIAKAFGDAPAELVKAAALFNGKSLSYGDCSVEVPALEGVSIAYVLWAKGEFPASATVLFDESAGSYLPTEDLAVLGELATSRLVKAQENLRKLVPSRKLCSERKQG